MFGICEKTTETRQVIVFYVSETTAEGSLYLFVSEKKGEKRKEKKSWETVLEKMIEGTLYLIVSEKTTEGWLYLTAAEK